jgi:hypothetical protein
MFTRDEVDALLNTSYRVRELAPSVGQGGRGRGVAIDFVRSTDGSVVVLPAVAVT